MFEEAGSIGIPTKFQRRLLVLYNVKREHPKEGNLKRRGLLSK